MMNQTPSNSIYFLPDGSAPQPQTAGQPYSLPQSNTLTSDTQNDNAITDLTNLADLVRVQKGNIQSGNFISGQTGWNIAADGSAEFQNVNIGRKNLTISSTQDIQTALNTLNTAGGGQLHLKAGTYTVTSALTGYSSISIIGENQSTTTINFAGTAANLTFTGTNVYTTGTISSISAGVNVVGSGTVWVASMIGQQIFINNRWYVISNVVDNTHLTLASGYADGTTFSGTYRISSVIHDVQLMNLTLQASTGTAIVGTDIRDFILQDCSFIANNKGYTLTNFMNINPDRITVASSTSNGVELTNGSFFNAYNCPSASNGGSGWVLNNVKDQAFILCAADSNTSDGFNCTSVINTPFQVEAAGNGGMGIQFVSGCTGNSIQGGSLVNNNISDGIKLTASSSNNNLGADLQITGNGGWGINIANANDNNNTIIVPYMTGNTSGNVQDLGTGTNQVLTGAPTPSIGAFGGNGTDGSLNISSGTTTLDLGASNVFIKSYTSISITGTGKLAFTNPGLNGTIIILKSQGAVTLTSSIVPCLDASVMGSSASTNAFEIFNSDLAAGVVGASENFSVPSNGGAAYTFKFVYALTSDRLNRRYVYLTPGSGGGSGGSSPGGTGTGGVGGRGGAALIIECGGALNFTGTISVAGGGGAVGSTGGGGAGHGGGGGGGGGGAGGMCLVLYNSLTANSGTVTITGGSGGTGGTGAAGQTGAGNQGGGGGGMYNGVGGHGGAGGSTPAGSGGAGVAGSNSSSSGSGGGGAGSGGAAGLNGGGGGGGGGGAAGEFLVTQNKYFS